MDLMDLTVMKLTAVMAMTMFLVGTEKKGSKDVGDDNNVVGMTCDGGNGDGDNSDGIVNNIGGNDSNDVVNSLTAIDGHDRQYFNKLRSTVVSRRIFIRSQSLIAR